MTDTEGSRVLLPFSRLKGGFEQDFRNNAYKSLKALAFAPGSFTFRQLKLRQTMRFHRLLSAGMAVAAASAFALTGCSQSANEAARQTGEQVGQAAKDAATNTGKAALAPAINPVLDLLTKSEGEVKAGNLAGAIASMGGFKVLWNTAAPVIQPLAGDKWPVINTAAQLVLSTFDKGAKPTQANALSAITGMIGPLSALLK